MTRSADKKARTTDIRRENVDKGESKGEQTRRFILSRALGIVSEVGYEGLSIGVLAQQTQLSKSGLFAHFKSKEALQLGVIQEVISRFTDVGAFIKALNDVGFKLISKVRPFFFSCSFLPKLMFCVDSFHRMPPTRCSSCLILKSGERT